MLASILQSFKEQYTDHFCFQRQLHLPFLLPKTQRKWSSLLTPLEVQQTGQGNVTLRPVPPCQNQGLRLRTEKS